MQSSFTSFVFLIRQILSISCVSFNTAFAKMGSVILSKDESIVKNRSDL